MKNKIKFLAALALTGLSFTAVQAQTNSTTSSSTAHFGVKGGVNFSNIYSDDVDDENVLTSFNAGLFANFPVGDILSIQPEVLYSVKGSELTYDNAFAEGKAKFKLNYIEVPILAKVNITDNLSVHAGPYFAYLVDAQIKNESSSAAFNFEEEYDNDDFNKFDVGISAGIGLDFSGIGIGARYNYGFQNIGKDGETSEAILSDGKNSSVSLYVSVKLN